MQIKCEYCGSFISEKDEVCPNCGAVNDNFNRSADGTPKTIEELKAWYERRNLPPKEVTRFFIGENYEGPKAFGIYEENGQFIVYKNKGDGTRAIRYSGKDEAYAVNEIYLRLKSEILNQKANNINNKKNEKESFSDKVSTWIGYGLFAIFGIGLISTVFSFISGAIGSLKDKPYAGNYYKYKNNIYYCESFVDDDWYMYDDYYEDYVPVDIPSKMQEDVQDYKISSDEWDESIEKFEDSDMGQYIKSLEDSSDSDSDYDWDSSDSWDSDSSDWDSDW